MELERFPFGYYMYWSNNFKDRENWSKISSYIIRCVEIFTRIESKRPLFSTKPAIEFHDKLSASSCSKAENKEAFRYHSLNSRSLVSWRKRLITMPVLPLQVTAPHWQQSPSSTQSRRLFGRLKKCLSCKRATLSSSQHPLIWLKHPCKETNMNSTSTITHFEPISSICNYFVYLQIHTPLHLYIYTLNLWFSKHFLFLFLYTSLAVNWLCPPPQFFIFYFLFFIINLLPFYLNLYFSVIILWNFLIGLLDSLNTYFYFYKHVCVVFSSVLW